MSAVKINEVEKENNEYKNECKRLRMILSESMKSKIHIEPQNIDTQVIYEQSQKQNLVIKQMYEEYEKMIINLENKDKEISK